MNDKYLHEPIESDVFDHSSEEEGYLREKEESSLFKDTLLLMDDINEKHYGVRPFGTKTWKLNYTFQQSNMAS